MQDAARSYRHSTLHIMLVAGSAEFPSRVRASLDALADIVDRKGAIVELWDLYQQPLPLLGGKDADATRARNKANFIQIAERADAFVLASPVYHNSYSGILKNALDHLAIQHFQHKPVALLCSGSNAKTVNQPCEHLSSVVRGLHAVPIPTQIVTLPADFLLVKGGYKLTDAAVIERLGNCVTELLSYAHFLHYEYAMSIPDVG
jgi:Predicted flavoprotein